MKKYLVNLSDGEEYKRVAVEAYTAREAESVAVRANPWFQCLEVVEAMR